MKILSLKVSAVVALALSAVTSANAAMPVARVTVDPSIVLADCAVGWYRGPDGQCYIIGMGIGGGYGYGGGIYYGRPGYYGHPRYYGHPGWHGGYYRHPGYHRGYHGGYRRRR
jgi:hypothetical protein